MNTITPEDIDDFHASILADDIESVNTYLSEWRVNGRSDGNVECEDKATKDSEASIIVEARDNRNRCALHIASLEGVSNEVFTAIVKAAKDIDLTDLRGRTALHYAVESRRKPAVELLLLQGAFVDAPFDGGMTPLHIAARDGLYAIAVLLLAFGAKAHKSLDLSDDAQAGSSKSHFIRKQNVNGIEVRDNPLAEKHLMSHVKNVGDEGQDLEGKIDVFHPMINYKRALRNPLHLSVCAGSLEVTALLIHDGSPLHENFPTHDIYAGKNCLHVAALLGYVEIVETFLRAGANVDAKTIDTEPELFLSRSGSNSGSGSGKTAYQLAEESGNPRSDETMRVLLSYASTRVVASGGKLESNAAKMMLLLGLFLGYIDIATDIAATAVMMQHTTDEYNHSNVSWATLCIISLVLPHITHAILQSCRGMYHSALRSIIGLELLCATAESLQTNTRSSTFMTMKYLMIAFQSIPQSMVQVTVLLVRWQHWGGRSSSLATNSYGLNLGEMLLSSMDYIDSQTENLTLDVTNSSSISPSSVPIPSLIPTTVTIKAYPRAHILILSFSIFTSLVTAMHTAVLLAATNEDSAWKNKLMRSSTNGSDTLVGSWKLMTLASIAFFSDGYVHIASYASFATVFRQYVFLPLGIMIVLVCMISTKAFGWTRPAFLRALIVSPLLSFVDFPLLPAPTTGLPDYWIFFRVLVLSSFLNFTMMTCSVVTALVRTSSDDDDYTFPYVSGTVFRKAGVWVMPLIVVVMYFVKMATLRVLLQFEHMNCGNNANSYQSSRDAVEELKSVTFRRSYLFGSIENGSNNCDVDKDSGKSVVMMTSNPLSLYGSKNAFAAAADSIS